MIKKVPKYTDVDLQVAIDSEINYPKYITELDFYHQIQSNQKIHWDVNPFVTDERQIRILLNASHFNRWKLFQRFGQFVGTFIAYWGLKTWTVEMFLLLAILPFTIVPLPHSLFILCMGAVISAKLYFNVAIPLFWIIIGLIAVSYVLVKRADEVATRFIIKQGLENWETFWRYYSKQIIYPVWHDNPDEIRKLIERYPELVLLENDQQDKCG